MVLLLVINVKSRWSKSQRVFSISFFLFSLLFPSFSVFLRVLCGSLLLCLLRAAPLGLSNLGCYSYPGRRCALPWAVLGSPAWGCCFLVSLFLLSSAFLSCGFLNTQSYHRQTNLSQNHLRGLLTHLNTPHPSRDVLSTLHRRCSHTHATDRSTFSMFLLSVFIRGSLQGRKVKGS